MTLSSKFHLLPLLVAAGAPAFSQSATQSIQGLVTDSTGAFVAGANITATNQGTNIALTTTSNETGNFTFPLLPVGDYTVRCERPGFKAGLVRGLRLETAAQVRQDFKLDVGSVTESIEVAANAVSLQTENATVGAVIENRRIVELLEPGDLVLAGSATAFSVRAIAQVVTVLSEDARTGPAVIASLLTEPAGQAGAGAAAAVVRVI